MISSVSTGRLYTALLLSSSIACDSSVAPKPPLTLPTIDRIAFRRAGADSLGDVYSMRFDGSDLRQLTTSLVDERCPRISPDGNWIAYYVFVNGSNGAQVALWLMRANGEEPRPIATIAAPVQCPFWSRSSDVVETTTYLPSTGPPTRETLQVFDLNGHELSQGEVSGFTLFEFSGDGLEFLGSLTSCSANGCGVTELAVLMRNGSSARLLTGGIQNGTFVAEGGESGSISWDGSLVVYVCGNGVDQNNFPIRAVCTKPWAGSNAKSLVTDVNVRNWPKFSPDGTRIAFICGPGMQTGICVIGSDGSNRITVPAPAVYDPPMWTADGTRVVFSCGLIDICVLDVQSGSIRNLTDGSGASTNASVARASG